MAAPKLYIFLCCAAFSLASQQSHIIPIEGYETELQDLGQHVEIPETPVKYVKITKTVAVKIPVPYPVKVREKVPYPVHVAKPYPVPVPQIIQVPHVVQPKAYHEHGAEGVNEAFQNTHQRVGHRSNAHDSPWPQRADTSAPNSDTYNGGSSGNEHNLESFDGQYSPEEGLESHEAPSSGYLGHAGLGGDSNSFDTKNYNQAINDYLQKNKLSGNYALGNGYNNY